MKFVATVTELFRAALAFPKVSDGDRGAVKLSYDDKEKQAVMNRCILAKGLIA